MIYKNTLVLVSDKTNVKLLKVFHLYKGFKRSVSVESFFIKGSVKKIKPLKTEYKGFKRKKIKKGDIKRGIIIKTCLKKNNLSFINNKLTFNSILIIKKKNLLLSKYIYGLVTSIFDRKKILILFSNIL